MKFKQILLQERGAYLHVKDGMLAVTRTDEEVQLFPVGSVTSILLKKGIKISSDAMALLLEHEIELLLIDRRGMPLGRFWSPKYGSISSIRKQQMRFSQSNEVVFWIRDLVAEKIQHQISLLTSLSYTNPHQAFIPTINKMYVYLDKIKAEPYPNEAFLDTLRGWEGTVARHYFQALNLGLHENYRFEKRSQHFAKDPFNAVLNYLYGMLYVRVEQALIIAGLDPYLGFFHKDEYNRPTLAFDMIEKYRIFADYVALQLFEQHKFSSSHFEIDPQNNVFLNLEGKKILLPTFNDYMLQVTTFDTHTTNRFDWIQREAHKLAQMLLKYETNG